MMMRLAPFMAVALALGRCMVPAAPEPEVAAGDAARFPGGCRVRIEFGSYAMGIDADALARIEAALDADRAVTAVDRQRWGREGEILACPWHGWEFDLLTGAALADHRRMGNQNQEKGGHGSQGGQDTIRAREPIRGGVQPGSAGREQTG